jgi:5-methylcytosine-specific restriction endonuclease McrA
MTDRLCRGCGKSFRSSGAARCDACLGGEHPCEACGRVVIGGHKRCQACRASSRQCLGCDKTITGTRNYCGRCRMSERECSSCGITHSDHHALCNRCRWASYPYEQRNAAAVARGNKRRAIKRAAEIAGPVPASVYSALRSAAECVYCGNLPASVDHVRPLARGGSEHEENLVPACRPCNHSKNDRLLTEWDPGRAWRAARASPKVACSGRELGHRV